MDRSRWLGPALAAALWALAIGAKLPILDAPPYWDEALHYWTAKQLGQGYDDVRDLWGNPVGAPSALLFQRPLFYVAFWLPAQAGFDAFRTVHAVAASILAPMAYAVLRAHGVRRPAALAGGAAVALAPQLVLWGNLGLMDSLMAAGVGAMLWARAMRRHALLFAAALGAVWTKETAYAAVAGLLAFEAWRGWRAGRCSFAPLRLDAPTTALAFAAALAPWPLMYATVHDLAMPGAVNHGSMAPVLDRMFVTPWLIPVLLAGLVQRRSRFLSAFALAGGAFLVALQVAARDVPQWYEVPTAFLALVGSAASADAWLRARPRPRVAGALPAAAAALLVTAAILLPYGPTRDLLRPLEGDGSNGLRQTWEFETSIRDADLHAAIAALPLQDRPTVLAIDLAQAALFYPIVEKAGRVVFDSSYVRTLIEVDPAPLAALVEANATWTLVDRSDLPMAAAIEATYGDCAIHRNAGFLVIEGFRCTGRAAALESAWRDRDPRF